MVDNNTVYYEKNLEIVNQPNKKNQDSLIEMAEQECVMQIAANALGNKHVSVEKKDLGNGKTRVTVSMRLVLPEGKKP